MIIFQIIGLLIVSGALFWVAMFGLACAAFHNIGGNGSWKTVAAGLLACAAGIYGICFIWAKYSPLTVGVA
ncbi:hypothetical protein K32_48990 [Kaistia sp. 32K]|uniref:hypothetical protein n=1 Tax=Kaistia sp. 32K TaxID=2795690 RepID=UPI0019158657|nr:hypothetical protein [Kaistia sp. 32K]BCP56282.1 hypothetical protein K32_48990 [Kaistia sp. 32K]